MNFQNLPPTLMALLLGWLFTLYVQHVSNRRTEALKRKDKIIDKLDDLAGWVDGEISKDDYDPAYTEEAYTGLLLHVELRANQFNKHVGREAINVGKIAELRDLDFFNVASLSRLPYQVRAISSQLVEDIELACDSIYFSNSLLRRIRLFVHEMYGVVIALLALIVLCVFIKIADWALYS